MEPLKKDQLFAPKASNASLWAKLGGATSDAANDGLQGQRSSSREERLRRRELERERRRSGGPAQLEAPSQELGALHESPRAQAHATGTAQLFAEDNPKLADLFHAVEHGTVKDQQPAPLSAEEARAAQRRRQAYETKRLRFQEKSRDSFRASSQDARKSSNGDPSTSAHSSLLPRPPQDTIDLQPVSSFAAANGQYGTKLANVQSHPPARAPEHVHTRVAPRTGLGPDGMEFYLQTAPDTRAMYARDLEQQSIHGEHDKALRNSSRGAPSIPADLRAQTALDTRTRYAEELEHQIHDKRIRDEQDKAFHSGPANAGFGGTGTDAQAALDARARYAQELELQIHDKKLREEQDTMLRNRAVSVGGNLDDASIPAALDARARYAQDLEQQIHDKKLREEQDKALRNGPANLSSGGADADAQAALDARARYAQELEQQIRDKKQREEQDKALRNGPANLGSSGADADAQAALDARARYAQELEQQIHDKKLREEQEKALRNGPANLGSRGTESDAQAALNARARYAQELEQQIHDKKLREEQDKALRNGPASLNSGSANLSAQAALDARARYAQELEQQIYEKKLREDQERMLHRGPGDRNSHVRGSASMQWPTEDLKAQYARELEKQIRDKKVREQQERLETRIEGDYSAPSPMVTGHAHRGIQKALGWGRKEDAASTKKLEYARYLEQQMQEKKRREDEEIAARRGLDTARSTSNYAPYGAQSAIPSSPHINQQPLAQQWPNQPYGVPLAQLPQYGAFPHLHAQQQQQQQPPQSNPYLNGMNGGGDALLNPFQVHPPAQYPPVMYYSGDVAAPQQYSLGPEARSFVPGSGRSAGGVGTLTGPSQIVPLAGTRAAAHLPGPASPGRSSVPRFTRHMADPSDPAVQAELAEKRMKQMAQRNELLSQMEMDQTRKRREKQERERQEREDEERLAREQREIQEALEREKEAQKRKLEHQEDLEKQIAEKKRQREEEDLQRKREEEAEEERIARERRELELKFKDQRRASIGGPGGADAQARDSIASARSQRNQGLASKAGLFDPAPSEPPNALPGTAQLFGGSTSPAASEDPPASTRGSLTSVERRPSAQIERKDEGVASRGGLERSASARVRDATLETLLKETAATRSEQAKTLEALELVREQLEDLRFDSSTPDDRFQRHVLGYGPVPQAALRPTRRKTFRDAGRRVVQRIASPDLSSPDALEDLGSPGLKLVQTLFPSLKAGSPAAASPLGQTLESESRFIFPDGNAFDGHNRKAAPRARRTDFCGSPVARARDHSLPGNDCAGLQPRAPRAAGEVDENRGGALNRQATYSKARPAKLASSCPPPPPAPASPDQASRTTASQKITDRDPDFDIYRVHEQNRDRLAKLERIGDCSKLRGDQLDAFLEDFLGGKSEAGFRRPIVAVDTERKLDCETRWLPA